MIKDRNWQVDLWNGKGVVMGFVRCYLRFFCAVRCERRFGHGFSFWISDWLTPRTDSKVQGVSFCFVIASFRYLVVVQSGRSVVSNLSSTLSVLVSFTINGLP